MNTPKPGLVAAAAWICIVALSACTKNGSPPEAGSSAPPAAAVVAATSSPNGGLPARLCGVLRTVAPELKGMSAVGARAQLVMAIANTFDADAKSLSTVSSDIDAIATDGCPEVRDPLLAATHSASLQEAVR
ncbi:MAG: hypothetical protein ABI281_10460 [Caldimonas sp.]